MSQQASDRTKKTGKKKIGMTKFLILMLYLLASFKTDFNFSFCYYWLFLRSKFSEGNYLSYMKL